MKVKLVYGKNYSFKGKMIDLGQSLDLDPKDAHYLLSVKAPDGVEYFESEGDIEQVPPTIEEVMGDASGEPTPPVEVEGEEVQEAKHTKVVHVGGKKAAKKSSDGDVVTI